MKVVLNLYTDQDLYWLRKAFFWQATVEDSAMFDEGSTTVLSVEADTERSRMAKAAIALRELQGED